MCAIAMMYVIVKDNNFLDSVMLLGIPCGNSSVIEDAETINSVPKTGVMSWGPHHCEGTWPMPLHHSVNPF